jgi:hypothetical protein
VTESTQACDFQQEISNSITERNSSNSYKFSKSPALDHFLDSPCKESVKLKQKTALSSQKLLKSEKQNGIIMLQHLVEVMFGGIW